MLSNLVCWYANGGGESAAAIINVHATAQRQPHIHMHRAVNLSTFLNTIATTHNLRGTMSNHAPLCNNASNRRRLCGHWKTVGHSSPTSLKRRLALRIYSECAEPAALQFGYMRAGVNTSQRCPRKPASLSTETRATPRRTCCADTLTRCVYRRCCV